MSKFWELLEQSVIIQGILTLALIGAWLYMMIAGLNIPPELHAAVGLVIGFFFGAKQSIYARKEAQRLQHEKDLIAEKTKKDCE